MKKVVALLAMLFGASVSMLAHADANQPATDSSQPTQQQAGTSDQGSTDNSQAGSTNGSTGSTGSTGSSAPTTDDSNDDDDTAS
ncbi:hypothetical protein BN59_00349 [Legionella massiliensis]|uniref:Uncharacterized protein n=1 Tax=Legionella massiliensis TaxID=1034943 RepID=A0A078KNY2_9GAMM|nr:hypothetical protein [Legionella massiliensis]CDZ76085.1 hypothetical protein BN59_00349 [Legionella massiliensis]CEE11823.1 hypothetical protein BN1094_00349 [Legionella massiliensis]